MAHEMASRFPYVAEMAMAAAHVEDSVVGVRSAVAVAASLYAP